MARCMPSSYHPIHMHILHQIGAQTIEIDSQAERESSFTHVIQEFSLCLLTLMTRFDPSVGMSAMLQVSSSLPAPGRGVKSMLSPRSITWRQVRSRWPTVDTGHHMSSKKPEL